MQKFITTDKRTHEWRIMRYSRWYDVITVREFRLMIHNSLPVDNFVYQKINQLKD